MQGKKPLLAKSEAGVSFIEVLVALAVFIIILLGVYSFLDSTQRIAITQTEIAEMDSDARLAVALMSTELREAGHNPNMLPPLSMTPAEEFISVRSDAMMGLSVDIRSDLDGDGDTTGANEYVRYEWDDTDGDGVGDLIRHSNSDGDEDLDDDDSKDVVASSVLRAGGTTLIFTYLDAGNTPIGVRNDIPKRVRTVRIEFQVQTKNKDRTSREYRNISMRETVKLRNKILYLL
jgi:hypothetical protein